MWTSTINHLSIHPSTSLVGLSQAVSSLPLKVFDQFFSSDLMERLVEESNAYAKTAMGDDKYDK